MKKGEAGVYRLNRLIQEALNPEKRGMASLTRGDVAFRPGDKVMQVKNDYQIAWTRGGEEGQGAFNGDIGYIESVDPEERALTVRFEDDRVIEYVEADMDALELSYCVSVHKSQGSEFPIVILPMFGAASPMMTRNLLYTAVTRAKRQVVCIGRRDAMVSMVNNNRTDRRYTALCSRLSELKGLGV